MANYIDGFLLPIAKKHLPAYRRMAAKAGKVWREHGALAYVECASEDMRADPMIPFNRLAKARKDEVVIFAWAVFKSRRERDRANAAIMGDPRIAKMAAEGKRMVDCQRMGYGGFQAIVQL